MQAKVILTITEGSLTGQHYVFSDRTTCIIGRARDCNPKVPDDEAHRTISRYHCLLDINPPNIRVRDFGSLNGTYVNNQTIGQRQGHQTPEEGAQINFPEYDLQPGDEIRLSNTVFRVSIEVAQVDEITQPPPVENQSDSSKTNQHLVLVQPVKADEPNLISIHGYTTLKLLGIGGCGEVYLVRDLQTDEELALKVMRSHTHQAATDRAIKMFQRETENTKALQHANVVQLWTHGYSNGVFYFILKYCDGGSVVDLMEQRGGRLPLDEAVQIILQVLDGLEYAHNADIPYIQLADGSFGWGKGLVHRDLKPGNIFLAHVGSSLVAKIGDYGLAKAFDLAGLSGLTMSGAMAGTPYFMPRQQVIDFKYAQPEVDIWATAASLYTMLTGAYPRNFPIGKDRISVVLQTDAVPIRNRNVSIPLRLADAIDHALVDRPEIYLKNAADFRQELLRVL